MGIPMPTGAAASSKTLPGITITHVSSPVRHTSASAGAGYGEKIGHDPKDSTWKPREVDDPKCLPCRLKWLMRWADLVEEDRERVGRKIQSMKEDQENCVGKLDDLEGQSDKLTAALEEVEDTKPSWCDHSRKEFWSKEMEEARGRGNRYTKLYDELLEKSEEGVVIDEHKLKFDRLFEAPQQACEAVPKMVFESALKLSPLNDIVLEASNRI
ncbi:MAG: hypothetical protein Q9219_006667 [cf. Caloplaca sp. 3 TL-2023]